MIACESNSVLREKFGAISSRDISPASLQSRWVWRKYLVLALRLQKKKSEIYCHTNFLQECKHRIFAYFTRYARAGELHPISSPWIIYWDLPGDKLANANDNFTDCASSEFSRYSVNRKCFFTSGDGWQVMLEKTFVLQLFSSVFLQFLFSQILRNSQTSFTNHPRNILCTQKHIFSSILRQESLTALKHY